MQSDPLSENADFSRGALVGYANSIVFRFENLRRVFYATLKEENHIRNGSVQRRHRFKALVVASPFSIIDRTLCNQIPVLTGCMNEMSRFTIGNCLLPLAPRVDDRV
jgi:hypothetical protein